MAEIKGRVCSFCHSLEPSSSLLCLALLLCRILITFLSPFFRFWSSSQTSWHFWSSTTSSSQSRFTLLWRCRSSSAPFSLAGIWTFIMKRVTRKLRSTPLTLMRSLGRYGSEVQEHMCIYVCICHDICHDYDFKSKSTESKSQSQTSNTWWSAASQPPLTWLQPVKR